MKSFPINRFPIRFFPQTPCYEKSICAYYCPASSDVFFMDLNTIPDSNSKSALTSLYNQNCVQVEKSNVDNIISNAINHAIDRFVDIMYYQTNAKAINIYANRNYNVLEAKTEYIPYTSEIRFPSIYILPNNIQIGALVNRQKLLILKKLLQSFVSQDDIKHICETAQINNGIYTPSNALLGLWSSYFTTNAPKVHLQTSDFEGLNVTALGNVVILQTVSAFSTRCNCSNIFSQPLAQPQGQSATTTPSTTPQQMQNYQTTFGQQTYNNYCPKRFMYMLSSRFMEINFPLRNIIGRAQQA